ncbi:MAG: VOC family protein [Candidatus Latescibacterota bacterium]|jgi:predicted enzyme related to lactoylglutathione lyase
MKARGTDFVLYEVADLERSLAFYRDLLGLEVETCLAEYSWAELTATPTTLALFDPKAMRPGAAPRTGGATVFLAVEDLKAAVEELRGRGVQVLVEPIDTPVCLFAVVGDPDGNAVGLHQRKDGTWG